MIDYDKSEWFGTTRIVGSVLPRSIPFACISVVITVLMIIHSEIAEQDTTEDTVLGLVGEGVIYSLVVNPYVHQVSLLSISFVIAFRVNLAYNRCARPRRGACRARPRSLAYWGTARLPRRGRGQTGRG